MPCASDTHRSTALVDHHQLDDHWLQVFTQRKPFHAQHWLPQALLAAIPAATGQPHPPPQPHPRFQPTPPQPKPGRHPPAQPPPPQPGRHPPPQPMPGRPMPMPGRPTPMPGLPTAAKRRPPMAPPRNPPPIATLRPPPKPPPALNPPPPPLKPPPPLAAFASGASASRSALIATLLMIANVFPRMILSLFIGLPPLASANSARMCGCSSWQTALNTDRLCYRPIGRNNATLMTMMVGEAEISLIKIKALGLGAAGQWNFCDHRRLISKGCNLPRSVVADTKRESESPSRTGLSVYAAEQASPERCRRGAGSNIEAQNGLLAAPGGGSGRRLVNRSGYASISLPISVGVRQEWTPRSGGLGEGAGGECRAQAGKHSSASNRQS
jgi:hypothetical protein